MRKNMPVHHISIYLSENTLFEGPPAPANGCAMLSVELRTGLQAGRTRLARASIFLFQVSVPRNTGFVDGALRTCELSNRLRLCRQGSHNDPEIWPLDVLIILWCPCASKTQPCSNESLTS